MEKLTRNRLLVETLLVEYPKLRDDDWLLYEAVIKMIRPEALKMAFAEICENHAELGLPSYEAIGRARRRVQEEKPWLKGRLYMEKLRLENEDLYRKYYSKLTEVRG